MELDHYSFEVAAHFLSYWFTSTGPRGSFLKAVRYTPLVEQQLYNVAFGDVVPGSKEKLDDSVITDNGDRHKILATVAATVRTFMTHYPAAEVFATGSTDSRTRLYQMAIAAHFALVRQAFVIYGLTEHGWSSFQPNQPYLAFLVKKSP